MKKENIPNTLTIIRIFMIPIFLIVLYMGFRGNMIVAGLIFAVASFTDWLDGHLARKWKVISNFGKFADPLADKMLTMSAFIMLVAYSAAPAWLVAIIICRELAVTGLRLLLVEQGGTVLAAAMPGKIKTATQMLSIILIFVGYDAALIHTNLVYFVGEIFLFVCLIFTIYSGIDYFWHGRSVFKNPD